MIEENYVSFETAKLLKEKGFDWECKTVKFYTEPDYDQESPDGVIAPTISMAMKWLRDTFHLEIYPFHDAIQENNDWWYRIERHSRGCGLTEHESDVIYKTYEDACEAGIKYCLEKLI